MGFVAVAGCGRSASFSGCYSKGRNRRLSQAFLCSAFVSRQGGNKCFLVIFLVSSSSFHDQTVRAGEICWVNSLTPILFHPEQQREFQSPQPLELGNEGASW